MVRWTGDPDKDFALHEAKQEAWLARRPVCADCGEPIQEDRACYINDEFICLDCTEAYLVYVEDYTN